LNLKRRRRRVMDHHMMRKVTWTQKTLSRKSWKRVIINTRQNPRRMKPNRWSSSRMPMSSSKNRKKSQLMRFKMIKPQKKENDFKRCWERRKQWRTTRERSGK
jgi:hypothetical protein